MATILFIATNEWEWGGSEILWSQAAERLAREGANVRVSIQGANKPREPLERIRKAGGTVVYRQPFSRSARLLRRFFSLPEYHDQHLRTVSAGVDLVVVAQSSFWEVLPWLKAVRGAGLRYVVIVQGANTGMWPDDTSVENLAPAFEEACGAFFVSRATLDLCRAQLGTPIARGEIVRNPFNVRYNIKPSWPNGSQDALRFACIGRLEAATKGQDILLEVLALPQWRERNVRVSLVGGGPHERLLKRHAERLALKSVDFVGHRADVESVLAAHHALVLPSRQEGLPLVLVEAMLCGRAAVVTDVGGNRELVRDGVNGFIAKAATSEFLNTALEKAWESRARLREIGERAALDVRQCVPEDPVGDFARQLNALARSEQLVTA